MKRVFTVILALVLVLGLAVSASAATVVNDTTHAYEAYQIFSGTQTGSDANNQKTTFVSLYGIEKCRQMIQQLTQQAIAALDAFENTDFLRDLALWLAQRDH